MTQETTSANGAGLGARMATLFRAVASRARGIFGPVHSTAQMPRRGDLLLSRREVLADQIRRAQRQHRPIKHLHKQACSVTNEILRRGMK